MKIRSIVSSLTAGALCLGAASVLGVPAPSSAADEPVKIMCVGDSITHGYINGDNGYRKYLCYYLQQNGIAYDMVGPNNNWTDETPYSWNGTTITYDPAHCGYSGYSTMSYSTGNTRTGIYETLFGNGNMMETYDPDMVLLQIGTNDLLDANLEIRSGATDITGTTTAVDRLETVVDKILENMDSTDVLFVSTIPDIDAYTRYDWLGGYSSVYGIDTYNDKDGLMAKVQECVDAYNTGVQALVAKKQAEGKNVQLGDVNSCIDYTAGDLEDGCHPSEQGYAKMGAHWAEKITGYLNDGGTVIEPPTTEETTEASEATTEATTETTAAATESTTTTEEDSIVTKQEGNVWLIQTKGASKVIITANVAANTGANGCIGYTSADSTWNQTDWEDTADAEGDLVYEYEVPEGIGTIQYQVWWPSTVNSVTAELVYGEDASETTTTESVAETTAEATTTETTAAEPDTDPTETTPDESVDMMPIPGDVNDDADVSLVDIVKLQKYLLGLDTLNDRNFESADMNQDDKVNAFDLSYLKRYCF